MLTLTLPTVLKRYKTHSRGKKHYWTLQACKKNKPMHSQYVAFKSPSLQVRSELSVLRQFKTQWTEKTIAFYFIFICQRHQLLFKCKILIFNFIIIFGILSNFKCVQKHFSTTKYPFKFDCIKVQPLEMWHFIFKWGVLPKVLRELWKQYFFWGAENVTNSLKATHLPEKKGKKGLYASANTPSNTH